MSNLHFHYGVMGASKSAALGITAFNLSKTGVNVEVIKPFVDNRDSATEIVSRIGIRTPARALRSLENYVPKPGTRFVLVDEVQFFSPRDIDCLVRIADDMNIIVMCYGLMIDSNERIFPAARRLIEVAAKIHHLESTCQVAGCDRLATHHVRYDKYGRVVHDGDQVEVGADQYESVCRQHFNQIYHNIGIGQKKK